MNLIAELERALLLTMNGLASGLQEHWLRQLRSLDESAPVTMSCDLSVSCTTLGSALPPI